MEYRSAAEAVAAFHTAHQLALSCVTRDVLARGASRAPTTAPQYLLLPRSPVSLNGPHRLALEVSLRIIAEENRASPGVWTAQILAYRYQISLRDGPEIIAFHWHPEEQHRVRSPHIHIGAGARLGFGALIGAHIPTGIVPFGEVVRFTIQELAVRPLRLDWRAILT